MDPVGGPVAAFAVALRKLREEAGSPAYRVMATRVPCSAATLAQAAAGNRLPTLPVTLAYVEACGADPEPWRTRWEEALAACRDADAAGGEAARAPYRGLARFEAADQMFFFGRTTLIKHLAALVEAHPFVLVVGPSGSGKSSVLRAGLVPALAPRMVRVLTPGAHPHLPDAQTGEVVVVDQFEEAFTLCEDPAERQTFIDTLVALGCDSRGTRVVLAVRADFLDRCAHHPKLAEAVRDSTVLVGGMTVAELREAITKPAAAVGLIVQRELTARIVEEVAGQPGGLPLMSHALLETWRRHSGKALTIAAYEATGGIHAAIARTCEACYAELTLQQQEQLRHLLLRLVEPGRDTPDTRRPISRAELPTDGDTGFLLERLAEARLVTLGDEQVDLAHEALLTAWPRLSDWIEEDRERIRLQRRLTEAATAWMDHDRDPGGLYRGVRLSAACEQFAVPDKPSKKGWGRPSGQRPGTLSEELTPLEREFLAASVAARDGERRFRTRRTAAISGLLVLTLVAALLAWQQNQTSKIREREADARRAAAVADSLRETDPVTAMRLSLAAWRVADLPETRSALLAAGAQRPQDVFTDPDGDPETMRYLSTDGRTLLSVGAGQVSVWDLDTRRRTALLPGLGADREQVGVRRGDAWTLPMRRQDGTAVSWDLAAGRRDERELGPATYGFEMGVSGRRVIGYNADGSTYRILVWDLARRRELLQVSVHREVPSELTATWDVGMAMIRSYTDKRASTEAGFPDAALSPDDRYLTLCVPGQRLQVWDMRARRRLDTPWAPAMTRRQCQYELVRFTPDSRRLAVITDEAVRLWDLPSGAEVATITHRDVTEIGFSADGTFLAATDRNDLLLWRVSLPEEPVFRHSLMGEQVTDLRVDPQANRIRYLGGTNRAWPTTVRTLDLGAAVTSQWQKDEVHEAMFSPDGDRLALAYRPEEQGVQLRIHRPLSGGPPVDLPKIPCPHPPDIPKCTLLLAFSSDGRTLAFGSSSMDRREPATRVSLWDVTSERTTDTLVVNEGERWTVGAIAFAPDDTSLLVAQQPETGAAKIWALRGHAVTKTVPNVTANQIALHPNRRLAVTSEGDVVDLRSAVENPPSTSPGITQAQAFSPGGGYLATGDGSGRTVLWDGAVHRRIGMLGTVAAGDSDLRRAVTALAFSRDESVLAVGTAAGVLQLWDVASRQPIGAPLPTPGDGIMALSFSADGNTLYAAGQHVPVQRYDLAPAATAAAVCRRARGGLPEADWRTHFPRLPFQQVCPPPHAG
ncbi:AAA family ATPase [Nonomuraea fuscirosea]|uniref:NACHT and WD repeat domain-containing protein n=1 Tax=Nonomuraea fuscirosea TaxID=1291556 RepID=UPI002DD816C4|nr:AAA family ATPase [Nonomuraea fuscirosea]WSA56700.1 AAA family ATPase [Nonomuraea fuscirosea]